MKYSFFYLFIIFFVSCKNDKSKIQTNSVSVDMDSIEVLLDSQNNSKIILKDTLVINGQEECVFDQETQTDEFLKGIKEIENYEWNSKTKTAEIVLNDHWALSIKRGGCDHFELSAEFFYERILNFERDKKIVFDNIIWITSLLKEFDGDLIKEVIDKEKISITKEDEFNYFINFMDERIYESYLMSFNNENITRFSISYSLN